MFRLETRLIIIILMVVIWTVPILMVVKYSTDYKALEKYGTDMKLDLDNVRSKLNSLEEQIQLNLKSSGRLANTNKRDIKQHNEEISDKNPTQSTIANHESKRLNIFVETNRDQILDKQFYKTLGGPSNQQQELFNYVRKLPEDKRKRILITGGAGFVGSRETNRCSVCCLFAPLQHNVGSHLVDSLMLDGHEVIVCDNFYTGRKSNIEHWQGHPNFELINHDVINPLTIEVGEIYHLASPASPIHYMSNPIKTIKTNTIGTINMLGLAKRVGARILIASTSEVYGDPEVHPQSETYWGHVNPVGPRSCYDESKRVSESLAVAYNLRENVTIGIARIFNTYGPRMHPNDGRVVSNFIIQSIANNPLTVYGTGQQTRSFQYVTDLVSGLKKLMQSNISSPVNLGNPNEMSISSLAEQIKNIMPNSSSNIVYNRLPIDDPHRRRPDIRKAMKLLDWRPLVSLHDGLERTIEYFIQELS